MSVYCLCRVRQQNGPSEDSIRAGRAAPPRAAAERREAFASAVRRFGSQAVAALDQQGRGAGDRDDHGDDVGDFVRHAKAHALFKADVA